MHVLRKSSVPDSGCTVGISSRQLFHPGRLQDHGNGQIF
jgi:hypothetical protein